MKDNTPENRTKYHKISAETKLLINNSKKKAWTDKCEGLNLHEGGREAWNLLHNMSGSDKKVNQKPFNTGSEELTSDIKKAEHINRHFAAVTKANKKTDLDRNLKKTTKEEERRKTNSTADIFSSDLNSAELDKALKLLKNRKAPGPDKIHNEMLKNLSEIGKQALLILLNKTWKSGIIPDSWKLATITPLLKKGKQPDKPESYRPISQTSCIGKVGEKIVNKRLYWWLETTGVITQDQAGFRCKSRTEDQLFRLTQKVFDGFQEERQTSAIFIDLQQAYDRVWKTGLLMKMQNLGIKSHLYNWIKSFLTDRLIQTKFNSALSSKSIQEEGLPQGSSLSCTLFLIFLNDITDVIKCEKALFADDLVLWHTSNSTIISQRRLQEDLNNIESYCKYWKLKVNTSKTVYSIFTRSHKIAKNRLRLTINNEPLTKEDNPTYLGVTLDRQLNLKAHVENVEKKASKRLNLIKRLASTTWGADKMTLRSLYLGYVRSVIDYNIVLQNSCSKATRHDLDKIQNSALRLICGGMRSSPISACEISADVEPLEIRRKKAALELYERAKRMEPNHPCRNLVDKWKHLSRLKQKSVLHIVEELKTKHHMPQNRQNNERADITLPPHRITEVPTIRKSLFNGANKKSDPNILKLGALETIDSYPKAWTHTYTDGSAFKATINAGYGAKIDYPNGKTEKIFDSCGSFCSNYVAEQEAISKACTQIHQTFQSYPSLVSNVVIYTDSLSTLQSLESGKSDNQTMSQMTNSISNLMSIYKIKVILQWIPGHSGVQGNESADSLAKTGASLPQPDVPVSMDTVKKMIRSNFKEEWLENWTNNNTGRALYNNMNAPQKKDPINFLVRKDQTTIFRLRTTHVPLNGHLNKIKKDHSAHCRLCGHPNETVEHHLLHCPQLNDLRCSLLPAQPSIFNTLFCDKFQLENTCQFFYRASSRRARAQ